MDTIEVGTWLKLFGPDDIAAMVGIGIIAVFFHRAKAINEQLALLLPIGIGGLVGVLQAWDSYLHAPAAIIVKAIMLGGGSGVIGRLVSVALDKMGIFPNPDATPVCPPKNGFP